MDEGLPGGGSLYLGELIDRHGSALSADFLATYGRPLWEVIDWPPRLVLSLVEELPRGCAFHAAVMNDPKLRDWDARMDALANLWDLIAHVNTDPKKKSPTYTRPGETKKQAGGSFLDMLPSRNKGKGGFGG